MQTRTLVIAGVVATLALAARHAWPADGDAADDAAPAATARNARGQGIEQLVARVGQVKAPAREAIASRQAIARAIAGRQAIDVSDVSIVGEYSDFTVADGEVLDVESADEQVDDDEVAQQFDAEVGELADLLARMNAGTGAIVGRVVDPTTRIPLAGVPIRLRGTGMGYTLTTTTDAHGLYRASGLPVGEITITFEGTEDLKRSFDVFANMVTTADDTRVGSRGVTIDATYTRNIPVGRTFEAVLGVAVGSQEDLYGVSISGCSTTSSNEFLEETEVITGGTPAEYDLPD